MFLMLFWLSIPRIVFFDIKKSCRYSCYDNWNRLNVIYSSYQLKDKTETSQDSKTSCDITYSAVLRDAKIEVTRIAHFYSCSLHTKSCSKTQYICSGFETGSSSLKTGSRDPHIETQDCKMPAVAILGLQFSFGMPSLYTESFLSHTYKNQYCNTTIGKREYMTGLL